MLSEPSLSLGQLGSGSTRLVSLFIYSVSKLNHVYSCHYNLDIDNSTLKYELDFRLFKVGRRNSLKFKCISNNHVEI